MAFSYEYLPDVAIADVAFLARADTLAELMSAAALAMVEVMVNPAGIRPTVHKKIHLESENREDLLYQWLSELLYIKDAEHLMLAHFNISISREAEKLMLVCSAAGEEIDPQRHELGQDVKAVTYHLFGIEDVGNELTARVVLDI